MHRLLNWAMALVIVLIFAAIQQLGTSPDKERADVAADVTAARAQAQSDYRRDMAAAALCREQYGESTYTWTQRGELVCTPRQGQSTTIYKGNK
jgi:type II secretory pathway pseudopilin PulG